MSVALVVARTVLAAVFAVAAAAKLADRGALRATLLEFGVPLRLVPAGAIALPAAELAVAGLLLGERTARTGAIAAVALLAVFCAAVAVALRRGRQPGCNCFGAHSAPVGTRTLVRNAALAALAAPVVAAGAGGSLGPALRTDAPAVAGVLALALLAWFVWQLFQQNARLLVRVRDLESAHALAPAEPTESGLPVGAAAPRLELVDPAGRPRSLGALLDGGSPVALVFSDPDCGACAPLVPQLERYGSSSGRPVELALITRDGATSGGLDHVLVQRDREAFEAFRIDRVPSATLVGADGRIATQTVVGERAIDELLASAGLQPAVAV